MTRIFKKGNRIKNKNVGVKHILGCASVSHTFWVAMQILLCTENHCLGQKHCTDHC